MRCARAGQRLRRAAGIDQHPPDHEGVTRLMQLFPFDGISPRWSTLQRGVAREIEHIRDFIVLHYHANAARRARCGALPRNGESRIAGAPHARCCGSGPCLAGGGRAVPAWIRGPRSCSVRASRPGSTIRWRGRLSDADMRRLLPAIREPIGRAVAQMPSQQDFLDRYCKAGPEVWGSRRQ